MLNQDKFVNKDNLPAHKVQLNNITEKLKE